MKRKHFFVTGNGSYSETNVHHDYELIEMCIGWNNGGIFVWKLGFLRGFFGCDEVL